MLAMIGPACCAFQAAPMTTNARFTAIAEDLRTEQTHAPTPSHIVTRRYKLSPLIQYSEFFSDPHALLVAFKLEGIVSKRLDRPYRSGRTTD